jgi:hypothetical protein
VVPKSEAPVPTEKQEIPAMPVAESKPVEPLEVGPGLGIHFQWNYFLKNIKISLFQGLFFVMVIKYPCQ